MSGPAAFGLSARMPEPRGADSTLEQDVLHRLAIWLAEVSSEAASAPPVPDASPPIRLGQGPRDKEPSR
jgi:hypothetical protein